MLKRLLWDFRNLSVVFLVGVLCFLAAYTLVETNPLPKYSAGLSVMSVFAMGITYILCCIALAGMVFGQEFDSGTMTHLLSQPLRRIRIWREKMLLSLAMMVALLAIANLLFPSMVFSSDLRFANSGEDPVWTIRFFSFTGSFFLLFAAWTSAPLFSLYLRQTHLAIWTTIVFWVFVFLFWVSLVESFLWEGIHWLFAHSSQGDELAVATRVSFFTLCAVSFVCFWGFFSGVSYTLARRLFLRLQLVPGGQARLGGNLSLPAFPSLALRRKTSESTMPLGRNLQLLLKEIRLQKSSLLFLALILLVWLVLWGLSFIGNTHLGEGFRMCDAIDLFRYLFVFPCLVFILPSLVGATAMAYERQLGVVDWSFSLPETRFKQWCIKVGVAAFIALVCGGVLGWALNWELERRLSLCAPHRSLFDDVGWLPFLLMPPLFFGYALYASSLVRDSLKALLGGALLLGGGILLLVAGILLVYSFGYRPWSEGLSNEISVVWLTPLSAALLIALTYWNYRACGFALRRFSVQVAIWLLWVSAPFLWWVEC